MGGSKKIVAKSTKTRKRASAGRDARVRASVGGKEWVAASAASRSGRDGDGSAGSRRGDAGGRGPSERDGATGGGRGKGGAAGERGAASARSPGRDRKSSPARGRDDGGARSGRSGRIARGSSGAADGVERTAGGRGGGRRGAGRRGGRDARGGRAGTRRASGGRASAGASTSSPRVDRSKRLLDLVMLLLRARTPVTYRDIREQFDSYQTANVEAGLRAFERDKADLLELGVPIRYITPDEDDSLEEGGYVVDLKRFRLPEVHLTAEEVSAMVLAASVARAVPGDDYARVVDLALKKLAFDVPEVPDTPLEWPPPPSAVSRREPVLVHFPSPQGRQTRELGERFAEIETATRHRKRVSFSYRPASTGYARTREVDPYGLFYREGSWLLVGYCHLRSDVRSFRLDRMSDLGVAPKP
ncbi:MAG TPA: WYL domain-containing protein, partial [Kofleriaceae bacterium]|nr:WYL domain-containing protein [Kofleriaceae bacterium]